MTEFEILAALRTNEPFKDLPNVRIVNLIPQPEAARGRFDAKFELQFDETTVEVHAEIKNTCTPKQVEQIAPWLARLKATQKDAAFALVCPGISAKSQRLCFEKNVDFIDLAGNVFINVPGKLLLQRVGMEPRQQTGPSFYRNPFSGKSSRILRVLLQKPRAWTLSDITQELAAESRRVQCPGVSFEVSFSLTSRVLRTLEEELLVRRRPAPFDTVQTVSEENLEQEVPVVRGNPILVPEPRRLLTLWAKEYKDRYRWYLRRSFRISNPFGANLDSVRQDLDRLLKPQCYAFSSAAAASLTAPFVDVDPIDVYISDAAGAENLRASISGVSTGPDLRVIYAFDAGVFLYSYRRGEIPVVSDIQTYLDLFARGGRDLKQADYLLQSRIEPMWGSR